MLTGLYAKLIGIGLIVAAVLGAWWYVSSLQAENERLTAEVTVLGSKLKDQNAAIATLKLDADVRLAAAQDELEAARAATEAAKKKSTIIYKTRPSTPGDDCKSALDLVNSVTDAEEKKALDLLNGGTK